jgi:molybdopterin converting factor small subunit
MKVRRMMTHSEQISGDRSVNQKQFIRVRLFASAREAAGRKDIEIRSDSGKMTAEVIRRYLVEHHGLKGATFVIAVNHMVISGESSKIVTCNDEVAVIPPVCGG